MATKSSSTPKRKRATKRTALKLKLDALLSDSSIQNVHKTREFAPGVTLWVGSWGYHFKGRMDAVIAAGIAKPDWFADGSERWRGGRVKRQKRFSFAGRDIQTMVRPPHYCDVDYGYTDEEAALYKKWEQRQRDDREPPKPEGKDDCEDRAVDFIMFRGSKIATFAEGALALYEDGDTVEIVREYGLVNATDNGMVMGYVVKQDGYEGTWFAPAHKLRLCDGSISHIKRVK